MTVQDFEVDYGALKEIAQKIGEIVQLKPDGAVGDFLPDGAQLAHDALLEVVEEFQGRWEPASVSMIEDIQEMAARLGKIATNYATYDAAVEQKVAAICDAMDSLPLSPLMGGQ
ncbi:MAG: hypothetical protein Q4D79_11870 [Propionibacteriaceae bacterium]|nr:hypothetical protein [Propionibacteriaceae bacterium]